MLNVGDSLPEFELQGDDGEPHTDKEFLGKKLVLYFYPRDNTPGCTREAIAFSKDKAKFAKAGARVVGVSRDTVKSHCKFRDQHDLDLLLLADPDLELHEKFGAWGQKTMYGKKVEGVIRCTFAFDEDGIVTHVWPSVKVDGHSEKVLAAISGEAPKKKTTKAPAKRATKKKR